MSKPSKKIETMAKKSTKKTLSLEERNAKFNALPPMKKRVAVAKDILLQLEEGTFLAGIGYGRLVPNEDGLCDDIPAGDLQKNLLNGIKCIGCAKAAVIISRAKLGDNVNLIAPLYSSGWLANHVSYEIFGKQCADMIENMYELSLVGLPIDEAGQAAYLRYRSELYAMRVTDRMRSIYQNIIDNKGFLVIGEHKY